MKIEDKDLKIESINPKYPGGQHVQQQTGVRVEHLPTKTAVECWDPAGSTIRMRIAAIKGIEIILSELDRKNRGHKWVH